MDCTGSPETPTLHERSRCRSSSEGQQGQTEKNDADQRPRPVNVTGCRVGFPSSIFVTHGMDAASTTLGLMRGGARPGRPVADIRAWNSNAGGSSIIAGPSAKTFTRMDLRQPTISRRCEGSWYSMAPY